MSLDFPQPGEIRTGVVASISPSQILVSVGAKSEGVITGRELEAIPAEERAALQVGQEILVYVLVRRGFQRECRPFLHPRPGTKRLGRS